ncbi:MAG: GNAT family N-acetyltransferase [Sphaerochaetaceae bacterium]|nr:GNAT family N-acetyltransferase [Sphaerochaetaceae bacterium]MDC7237675.1 GNAT family N-acetyltransferase [Sphaerochaetaceae bacterium]
MDTKLIRLVREDDVREILDIYAPYVKNTSITFECTTPSLKDFNKKVSKVTSFYPFLVCEVNNSVIGYAYADRIREREAYDWDVELSIYLNQNYSNLGIGKILYEALLDILKLQNIYNAYGVITLPNKASVKLHKKLGFKEIGVFHNTGFKFNKWYDVIWFEKTIQSLQTPPDKIKPFSAIDKNKVTQIISNYNKILNSI